MNKLTVAVLGLSFLGCAHGNIRAGYEKWHRTGKLYVVVNESKRELVRDEAEAAIGQWVVCGTQYEAKLPKTIIIAEEPMPSPKENYVLCGLGELNGDIITINEDEKLFIFNKACVSYKHTIGHELAHLMGYEHETDAEYAVYNARMAACGFKMKAN